MRELERGEVKVGMYVVVELYDGYATEGVVTSAGDTRSFVVGYHKDSGSFSWKDNLRVFLNEKVTNEIKLITPIAKSAGNVSCGYLEDGKGGRTLAITKTKSTELSKGEVKEETTSPTKSEWEDNIGDTTAKDSSISPVKSTGGSSKYYEITLPQGLINKHNINGYIMLEDLAEVMFNNDFNYVNVFKAQKRMFDLEQGRGKEGNTLEYDATKCKYYIDKQVEVFNRNKGE